MFAAAIQHGEACNVCGRELRGGIVSGECGHAVHAGCVTWRTCIDFSCPTCKSSWNGFRPSHPGIRLHLGSDVQPVDEGGVPGSTSIAIDLCASLEAVPRGATSVVEVTVSAAPSGTPFRRPADFVLLVDVSQEASHLEDVQALLAAFSDQDRVALVQYAWYVDQLTALRPMGREAREELGRAAAGLEVITYEAPALGCAIQAAFVLLGSRVSGASRPAHVIVVSSGREIHPLICLGPLFEVPHGITVSTVACGDNPKLSLLRKVAWFGGGVCVARTSEFAAAVEELATDATTDISVTVTPARPWVVAEPAQTTFELRARRSLSFKLRVTPPQDTPETVSLITVSARTSDAECRATLHTNVGHSRQSPDFARRQDSLALAVVASCARQAFEAALRGDTDDLPHMYEAVAGQIHGREEALKYLQLSKRIIDGAIDNAKYRYYK